MTENMIKAVSISTIIAKSYEKIIRIDCEEDSDEYLEEIENIKKNIPEEIEAYNRLTIDEVLELARILIDTLKLRAPSLTDIRVKQKLNERKEFIINDENLDAYLIRRLFDSKLTIEALKIADKRVKNLESELSIEELESDYIKLAINVGQQKYIHLTNNVYLEDIALNNNFSIEDLPDIPIEKIEELHKKNYLGNIKPLIFTTLFNEMGNLMCINCPEPIYNTANAVYYMSKIEALLNLCDKRLLEELSTVIESKYPRNNELTKQVNKLIRRRKESLI